MKKDQKYTQEEILLAVDMWKESGLTKAEFCKRENISPNTLKYWQRRYKHIRDKPRVLNDKFIPVEVPGPKVPDIPGEDIGNITITYPNGIQVSCPLTINDNQLRSLINP